jgi:hypothetical protein
MYSDRHVLQNVLQNKYPHKPKHTLIHPYNLTHTHIHPYTQGRTRSAASAAQFIMMTKIASQCVRAHRNDNQAKTYLSDLSEDDKLVILESLRSDMDEAMKGRQVGDI